MRDFLGGDISYIDIFLMIFVIILLVCPVRLLNLQMITKYMTLTSVLLIIMRQLTLAKQISLSLSFFPFLSLSH